MTVEKIVPFHTENIYPSSMDISIPNLKRARDAANKVLKENPFTSWSVPVEEFMRTYGFCLLLSEFGDESVSGVLNFIDKYLALNVQDSSQRRRFTMAYGLGRFILHQSHFLENQEEIILYRGADWVSEDDPFHMEANCFAANLLVPEKMLRRAVEIGRCENCKDPCDAFISNLFNVSKKVIEYRRKSYSL